MVSDIPVADDELTTFYAARIYTDKGSSISPLACNGAVYDKEPGYWSAQSEGGIPIGSLFVHAGCSFHGFNQHRFKGEIQTYKGPISYLNGPPNAPPCPWNKELPCFRSFITECRMRMPNCTPSDSWSTVAYLDNSASPIPTKLTYENTVGTAWSSEILQAFDVHYSVDLAMKQSFFKLFSKIVLSNTGYNWQSISSKAKSEEKSYITETTVPAGARVKIEQALGHCGASEVKTEMFVKTYHYITGESNSILG